MIRTALCTAVLSVSGLFAVNAGAVMLGGEGCCSTEAVAVNAEGETCSKPAAEAVAVNAAGEDCGACEGEAEAVAVGNPEAEAMPAALFTPVNAECPGSGMPVKDGVNTIVSGFTVGFCCGDCKEAFDAKPAAEQAAFVAEHVTTTVNTECPGSGMPVAEGKLALYNGFAVGFCCDDCKAAWHESDDAKKVAFIAKNHAPENADCPGSGNPINAEVVALYRGHTVGFCCEGCQGKFHAMSDDEKTAILAGFAMGAESSASCEDCENGECDGDCSADA
jgi:YHS domain-containing protein